MTQSAQSLFAGERWTFLNTRRGRSRGVLVADALNFKRAKGAKFHRKPPFLFVSEQSWMSTLSVQKV